MFFLFSPVSGESKREDQLQRFTVTWLHLPQKYILVLFRGDAPPSKHSLHSEQRQGGALV